MTNPDCDTHLFKELLMFSKLFGKNLTRANLAKFGLKAAGGKLFFEKCTVEKMVANLKNFYGSAKEVVSDLFEAIGTWINENKTTIASAFGIVIVGIAIKELGFVPVAGSSALIALGYDFYRLIPRFG